MKKQHEHVWFPLDNSGYDLSCECGAKCKSTVSYTPHIKECFYCKKEYQFMGGPNDQICDQCREKIYIAKGIF